MKAKDKANELVNKFCDNGKIEMKGQFVIIDLRNMDFMKNEEGKIKVYDTEEDAYIDCGMYEFENAWVMQLMYNHNEAE